MEDLNKKVNKMEAVNNTSSMFIWETFYTMVLFYWKWFLLSLILCVGLSFAYLRYATAIYESTAKILVKDNGQGKGKSYNNLQNVMNTENLGLISNTNGFDNELEMLKSSVISTDVVTHLGLYVTYRQRAHIKKSLLYKDQPLNVNVDPATLKKISNPVELEITRQGSKYRVVGRYYAPITKDEEYLSQEVLTIDQTLNSLPGVVSTKIGDISISYNKSSDLASGNTLYVTIYSPEKMGSEFAKRLDVQPSSKTTTIAVVTLKDESPQRAIDYLDELVNSYNRQANEEKNDIASRTENFINDRLAKITGELGNTDSKVQSYMTSNNIVDVQGNAASSLANANEYDKKLIEVEMQESLFRALSPYINSGSSNYQVIPENVGLEDNSASSLIKEYNKLALNRLSLLRSTTESNPVVKNLTAQLDELKKSLKLTVSQAQKALEIQKHTINSQYKVYKRQMGNSPVQQRVMTEIGRQQEVQTALYTMLLQKREENSISLAATADKGELIDKPTFEGKVSPRDMIIYLIGLVLGLGIPFAIITLRNVLRYRISNHEDVSANTDLPIIADIAVANEEAKTQGEIVVHENKNNMMEEIFRSIRTNMQFMLQEGQKVILVTSCIAGEGKTFCASNIAMSFALLGKKVVLVGMDIRKPRLSELFALQNHQNGITNLLSMANPTLEDVKTEVMRSGLNANLDVLLAGPTPPNPSEMVERKQLSQVIDILKQEYDYVVLDTAPIGLVTDTLQFAHVADMTLVIIRSDHTPREMVTMINDLAESGKLPNAAIAINGIDMSKKRHSYYYGYGRYGKYSRYKGYASYGRQYKGYGKYGYYGGYHRYGSYGTYGSYGHYSNSGYSSKHDNSVKI